MKTMSISAGKPFLLAMLVFFQLSFSASASTIPPKTGYVQVNGMKMYYEIYGPDTAQSMPLIVLHGAYMNIISMGDIIPKLAKSRKVYAVELQGHGRTNDINRPITYQNLADDVAIFMDAMKINKADIFVYSMGACTGLQLVIRHPERVNKFAAASVSYDVNGWQPVFKDLIPQMTLEMFEYLPFEAEYRKLSPNPDGFDEFATKMIQLEKEPMAWENDVKNIKTPILIIAGDADVATLEHSVAMFRLLGGGGMGDMGVPLPASRLAVLPATSHTAVIGQSDLLVSLIDPFLKGVIPKGMF